MRVARHLHAVRIPFTLPLSPEQSLVRDVYAFQCLGEEITLIDSGVNGAEVLIYDEIKGVDMLLANR